MNRTAILASCGELVACALPCTAQPTAASSDWKRGAVCYEIFVRSFYDSDGDGVGDLNGLIQKLDYINDGDAGTRRGLGARCIWLMPVAESPSYHGYDVTNYYRVERDYGTNEDFKRLVAEAHRAASACRGHGVNHVVEPPVLQGRCSPELALSQRFRWSATKPD